MADQDGPSNRYRIKRGLYEGNIGTVLEENPDDPGCVLIALVRFGEEVTVEVRRDEIEPLGGGGNGVREPRPPRPRPPGMHVAADLTP